MQKALRSIVLYSASSPFLAGVYKNGVKEEEYESGEKTSRAIVEFFEDILGCFEIDTIYFAKGPGSFMSIKITYIFLKTLSVTKNIKLKAVDSFFFSKNGYLKASKNSYFLKKEDTISLTKIGEEPLIFLPEAIEEEAFSDDCEPFYYLPPV